MVAGMTSEGGGAVAFPVKPLTLPLAFTFPFLPPFTFNFLPCPSLTTSLFHLCPHLTSVFDLHEGHIFTQVSHNALLQVMTLALGIAPTVARDFSVMIQSIGEHHKRDIKSKSKSSTEGERVLMTVTTLSGMSAASFTILWMKVKLCLQHHAWYQDQQNVFQDYQILN